jgi:hypothetical protein
MTALTANTPLRLDTDRMSLRRGFIDGNTPLAHLHELQLPIEEQRALLRSWIKELENERHDLCRRMGKKPDSRNARKNLSHKVNKNPLVRNLVRRGDCDWAKMADRFLDCGREMQVLQRLMETMKPSVGSSMVEPWTDNPVIGVRFPANAPPGEPKP